MLLTGDRVGTAEIIRRTGLGKVSVWRWQGRTIEAAGVVILLTIGLYSRRATRADG